MKFGKTLKSGDGTLTMRYGELKKQLKLMTVHMQSDGTADADGAPGLPESSSTVGATHAEVAAAHPELTADEAAFVTMLNEDLASFNSFFIEAEEDAIIKLDRLQRQAAASHTPQEQARARAALVDFHGELVLLCNWSSVNSLSLSKILKKHDKVTKLALKQAYLASALQQPFCSTKGITGLIASVEQMLQPLEGQAAAADPGATAALPEAGLGAPTAAAAAGGSATEAAEAAMRGSSPADATADEGVGGSSPSVSVSGASPTASDTSQAELDIRKRTERALSMWEQLSSTAKTPSTVVPPHLSPTKRRRLQEPQAV